MVVLCTFVFVTYFQDFGARRDNLPTETAGSLAAFGGRNAARRLVILSANCLFKFEIVNFIWLVFFQ